MEPEDGDYRKMGFFSLFFISFFWVCGGPWGNEGMVQLGPSGVVFAVYAAVTLLYSIPVALINAELAVAIPEDGGLVVWVGKAFGGGVGGHNAWWYMCSIMFDAAIYPLLFAQYILSAAGRDIDDEGYRGQELGIAWLLVLVATVVKLLGPDIVAKFAGIATLVSLFPVAVMLVWSLFTVRMRPERWVRWFNHTYEAPPSVEPGDEFVFEGVNWGLLLSWCIWMSSGYLGLGSLAAGIENPKVVYTQLLCALIPFVMAVYILPFLVSLSLSEEMALYEAGHFAIIAKDVAGPWLTTVMRISAIVCVTALYTSVAIMAEVSMQAFLEERSPMVRNFADLDSRRLDKEGYQRGLRYCCTGSRVRRWLFFHTEGGAAPVYILVNAAAAAVLLTLPYRLLIEFTSTLLAAPTLLFLASFIALRIQQPRLKRDFRIPGGLPGAVLLSIPPAMLTCSQFILTVIGAGSDQFQTEDPPIVIGGWELPMPSLFCSILIIVIGALAHLLVRNYYRCCCCYCCSNCCCYCCVRWGLEEGGAAADHGVTSPRLGQSVRIDRAYSGRWDADEESEVGSTVGIRTPRFGGHVTPRGIDGERVPLLGDNAALGYGSSSSSAPAASRTQAENKEAAESEAAGQEQRWRRLSVQNNGARSEVSDLSVDDPEF